jgi:8-oxo-dGTP diphosphatase
VAYLLRGEGEDTQVLLGRKKSGLGSGRTVGLGGKIEAGETPLLAAVREIEEESGLIVDPADLDERGMLEYRFPTHPDWSQRSTIFVAHAFRGELAESDELAPDWYPLYALPLDRMWHDASFWLPQVLAGARIAGYFTYGPDEATVVDHKLTWKRPVDLT